MPKRSSLLKPKEPMLPPPGRLFVPLLIGLLLFNTLAADCAETASPGQYDAYGDPLPAGALRRFGTIRFRSGELRAAWLAATPDGKQLITVTQNGVILIWDAVSGRLIRKLGVPDESSLASRACISPNCKTVALAQRQRLRLMDVTTGKHIDLEPFGAGGNRRFADVAFSADGKTVACAGTFPSAPAQRPQWEVTLCNVSSGKQLQTIKCEQPVIGRVGFIPGTSKLIFADEQAVHVWDAATGREIRKWLAEESNARAELSPDGRMLAVGRNVAAVGPHRYRVALWDARTGKKLHELDADPELLLDLAFTSDAKRLAGAGNRDIRVWDTSTGRLQRDLSSRDFAMHLVFMPDCRTLCYTGFDHTIHKYDVVTGKAAEGVGNESAVSAIEFSPNGKMLATASARDHRVNIWNAGTAQLLRELDISRMNAPCFAFASGGSQIVVPADNAAEVWDVATGKEVRRTTLGGSVGEKPVDKMWQLEDVRAGQRDGQVVLCAVESTFDPRQASLAALEWDLKTGKASSPRWFPAPHPYEYAGAALSPDGTLIVGPGPTIRDAGTGISLSSVRMDGGPQGRPVLSPDGTLITTRVDRPPLRLARPGSIPLCELFTGGRVRDLKVPMEASAMAFAPDGRLLASGDDDAIYLWDMATGKLLGRRSCPDGRVTALAFSPNGRLLASGLQNTTTLLWDVTAEASASRRRVNKPSRELPALWADLIAEDAAKGQAAVWTLVDVPDEACPFLKQRLNAVKPPDASEVSRLIARLNSISFSSRTAASNSLQAMGEAAWPAVRAALQKNPSPEAKQRLEKLLTPRLVRTPESLRTLRAIEALEIIGSPEAREILTTLAAGDGSVRETRNAQAALRRIQQRNR